MNTKRALDCLFNPKSVAVIGASSFLGKWGYNLLSRLISTRSKRHIYAINDREAEVLGLKAYKNVLDVPEQIDMAAIAYFGPNRPPSRSKPATLSEQIGHHRLRFKAL